MIAELSLEPSARLVFLILTISFNNHLIHCQVVNQAYHPNFATSSLIQQNIENTSSETWDTRDDKFWINLDAGAYYTPFLLENDFSQYVNKTEPSFSLGVSMTYSFNKFHSLNLGVGRFETDIIKESIHTRINSNFIGYPINLTFYYQLDEILPNTKPFIGIGLIYIFVETNNVIEETESEPQIWETNTNYNGYGIDGKLGLSFFLNDRLQLKTTLTLQYVSGAGFSSYSYNVLDFTGVQLTVGIGYNI